MEVTEELIAGCSGVEEPAPDSSEVSRETEAQRDDVVNPPSFVFSRFSLLTQCKDCFKQHHCLRGCKWSPDGTCLLTNCEDRSLRLLDLPQELYNRTSWDGTRVADVAPSLRVTESGLVYDFDWYPFMSSWDRATSCFVCTSTDCPVHLYDAFTGQIRASYRGYDQYDEVAHAFCVSFSSTGTSIYCGYKDHVKMFDVSKPGRDCLSINTKHQGKQKGIISCICDNPDMPKVFAAGSYRRVIGVYSSDGSLLCQLLGQKGGLTEVKFSQSGVRLYSAGRKDPEILCWDLRQPGKTLFSLRRPHSTNQRIYFDLSSDDKHLVSGCTDGKVRVWNVFDATGSDTSPQVEFAAHNDCTNGVSFHRQLPIISTCSGQRHVPEVVSDSDEDSKIFTNERWKDVVDNSVKLWWVGPLTDVETE